jgi:chemotaxis signal transduction protein
MPTVTNSSLFDNSHERLQSSRHCVFRCGESWYSVPATAIREVTIANNPVSLPGAPAWLDGIVHLQSEFIPVISLSRFLDLHTNTQAQPGRLLVINGNPTWAIHVCEVATLSDLDATLSPGGQSTGIVGTFTWGNHIARVLEPRHMLGRIQKSLHDQWNPESYSHAQSSCPNTIPTEIAN